jgi:hypothetical protein
LIPSPYIIWDLLDPCGYRMQSHCGSECDSTTLVKSASAGQIQIVMHVTITLKQEFPGNWWIFATWSSMLRIISISLSGSPYEIECIHKIEKRIIYLGHTYRRNARKTTILRWQHSCSTWQVMDIFSIWMQPKDLWLHTETKKNNDNYVIFWC